MDCREGYMLDEAIGLRVFDEPFEGGVGFQHRIERYPKSPIHPCGWLGSAPPTGVRDIGGFLYPGDVDPLEGANLRDVVAQASEDELAAVFVANRVRAEGKLVRQTQCMDTIGEQLMNGFPDRGHGPAGAEKAQWPLGGAHD
jgi:hypothetical protein